MLQVSTNSTQTWNVDYRPNGPITVNNELFDWDITVLGEGKFHVVYNNQSVVAEVIEADYVNKAFQLKLNGQLVNLQVQDRFDLLLSKLGMSAASANKVNELKAPMPGLIVAVRVEPGQVIQKGDALLVLEAMKMENILKAPADGTIAAIKVGLRDNVTKGQVLIQFS
ncbi:biotin/lipoyl-binding protein [Hymenobacter sp. BT186]|uniref:Biotin/lipoyl-binding protein n=1 Tax=Hymenobacter telluris TaxID=2816474 RepID=A0A939EST7_9BACT|nr:biotin/lipoyl-containing protein [Hymenobacter telluris]MBO0357134.1 biotin/lipoyl-binding protein [Hymenobacter telluris]MBW3373161.1 biotin/lipoyl-binding protein [Hymenobacter norwichensis]